MMVRRAALEALQRADPAMEHKAFDEAYFMYCEDVDLSWRIRDAGFQAVYFPGAHLIHYKGESTRKATLQYVRIFNEALATFVRKHYNRGRARAFIGLLRLGIWGRAILGALKNAVKAVRMPLFDAFVLLIVLWGMKSFWTERVKDVPYIPLRPVLITFPVYVAAWIASLFLNGAYDAPYRALRVVRGMAVGTIAALAFYGLLPEDWRYSRAVLVFGGITGTVVLLALHETGRRLGIFSAPSQEELPHTALIVAEEERRYTAAATLLRSMPGAPRPLGWISAAGESHPPAMGDISGLCETLHATGAAEAIFCIGGALDYATTLACMQRCGPRYDYKIQVPGSAAFVGSSSSLTSVRMLAGDPRYNLSGAAHLRTKRVFDIIASLALLILYPILAWRVRKPGAFLRNIFAVLSGRLTWVGYAGDPIADRLPRLRPAVVPALYLQEGYTPSSMVAASANETYARMHQGGTDAIFLWRNFPYLGG